MRAWIVVTLSIRRRVRQQPLENVLILVALAVRLLLAVVGHPGFAFLTTIFWSSNRPITGRRACHLSQHRPNRLPTASSTRACIRVFMRCSTSSPRRPDGALVRHPAAARAFFLLTASCCSLWRARAPFFRQQEREIKTARTAGLILALLWFAVFQRAHRRRVGQRRP